MTISDEVPDAVLQGCKRPEDLPGAAGLMREPWIRLMERMHGAERPRIWAMKRPGSRRRNWPTAGTRLRRSGSRVRMARFRFRCRAAATAASSPIW